MTTPTQNSTAIYCRLSYAPDKSVEKVERQEADCRQLADRLGWTIGAVYADNSRSAWQRNRKRPAWERMLSAIESGRHDRIVVYHGDRLIRQPWDLELLLRLSDNRGILLASPSGTRDLSSAEDRFILRIEVAQACKSSDDTSRRVRRASKARAERGVSMATVTRPFGYGVEMKAPDGETVRVGTTGKPIYDVTRLVPHEAALLREAGMRLLAGGSLGGVVAWMNQRCTTTAGGQWSHRAVKRLLTSPRVAGLIAYREKPTAPPELKPAKWEAVFTRDEWEDIRAALARCTDNGDGPGNGGDTRRASLLSGIAECSGCGKPMRSKPVGGRNKPDVKTYWCVNRECPARVSRSVKLLDDYVTGRVLRLLNDRRFIDALYAEDAKPGLAAEITSLERQKEHVRTQLENLADNPYVSAETLVTNLARFDEKIAALRAEAATSRRARLLHRMAGISREAWDAEPVDVKAATVRMLYRVVVLPTNRRGPGFDSATVRLERVKP